MNLRYFRDTDTLLIELRDAAFAETRDLDAAGGLCGLTIEQASRRAGAPTFSFEAIGA